HRRADAPHRPPERGRGHRPVDDRHGAGRDGNAAAAPRSHRPRGDRPPGDPQRGSSRGREETARRLPRVRGPSAPATSPRRSAPPRPDPSVHEQYLVGLEYLEALTALLRRVRSAHPTAGHYEAADFQWWWRIRRPTDTFPQLFWF